MVYRTTSWLLASDAPSPRRDRRPAPPRSSGWRFQLSRRSSRCRCRCPARRFLHVTSRMEDVSIGRLLVLDNRRAGWAKHALRLLHPNPTLHRLDNSQRRSLATSRGTRHWPAKLDLPPAAEIRAPKSAFALISSALTPGTDLQGGAAEGPNLTRWRH